MPVNLPSVDIVIDNYTRHAVFMPIALASLLGGIAAIRMRRLAKKPLTLLAALCFTLFLWLMTFPYLEELLDYNRNDYPGIEAFFRSKYFEQVGWSIPVVVCTIAIMWGRKRPRTSRKA